MWKTFVLGFQFDGLHVELLHRRNLNLLLKILAVLRYSVALSKKILRRVSLMVQLFKSIIRQSVDPVRACLCEGVDLRLLVDLYLLNGVIRHLLRLVAFVNS